MVRWFALLAALMLAAPSPAINLVIDYTYDTNQFFGSGNPSGAVAGAQARAALEAAADYLSAALTDTFSPIVVPPSLQSSLQPINNPGTFSWNWTQSFTHPATGANVTLQNRTFAADEYRVFAGAGSLPALTLGVGGPGGLGYSAGSNGGNFTQAEVNQINATTDTFISQVTRRGEPVGEFANWGGSIRFDNDGSSTWHYDHTASVVPGRTDFYTVALHELTHALGFGIQASPGNPATVWDNLKSGAAFAGSAARAANGGVDVPLSADGGHWTEGKSSTVYGGSTLQETLMDPTVSPGVRKRMTTLDAAAMDDIGWDIVVPTLTGDYNFDGFVNAADYTIWRDSTAGGSVIGSYAAWKANYGATLGASGLAIPEPASLLLALAGVAVAAPRRR